MLHPGITYMLIFYGIGAVVYFIVEKCFISKDK